MGDHRGRERKTKNPLKKKRMMRQALVKFLGYNMCLTRY